MMIVLVIEAALVVRVHWDHAMLAVPQDVRVSGLNIITARIEESLHGLSSSVVVSESALART